MSSWRATLLSDTPRSRREAKLGQLYKLLDEVIALESPENETPDTLAEEKET